MAEMYRTLLDAIPHAAFALFKLAIAYYLYRFGKIIAAQNTKLKAFGLLVAMAVFCGYVIFIAEGGTPTHEPNQNHEQCCLSDRIALDPRIEGMKVFIVSCSLLLLGMSHGYKRNDK